MKVFVLINEKGKPVLDKIDGRLMVYTKKKTANVETCENETVKKMELIDPREGE